MSKLTFSDLGYSQKWMDYGLISQSFLFQQLNEFENSDDQNTEHYRYAGFLNWLRNKDELTDKEVENYLELALEDHNEVMAGSAVKELFYSPLLTESQLAYTQNKFKLFGEWTLKHIQELELKKRFRSEELTPELIEACLEYSEVFKSSHFLREIIQRSEDSKVIEVFTSNDFGKKIRILANQKLKRIKKRHY